MNDMKTNRLAKESSPYLLQHAANPVNWFPWGEEALKEAAQKNKLLVISIGYSACHWCHVMEKESFEDSGVAELMNKHYISIKVDREERPDIDHVYMQAAYLINGSGGWPLNVIALPDGRPVYAGTYFTKDKWGQVLSYFSDLHINQPDLLLQQAESLSGEIKQSFSDPAIVDDHIVDPNQLKEIYKSIAGKIDPDKGGMWGAPKFPMPVIYEFLLYYYKISEDEEALSLITNSLDRMGSGGIYDQLGGGFCRYSTDAEWRVPHFEKMLYDNAQLISLYAKAYSVTGNHDYERIVRESIDFVVRELGSPDGGFYSALDADSEGIEGQYYVWTKKEVLEVGGSGAEAFCRYFNILEEGNWEDGKNILFSSDMNTDIPPGYTEKDEFHKIKTELLKQRSHRIRPQLDNKIICSWNAMMLTALLDAYCYLEDESYLKLALKNASFLEENMITPDYRVYRNINEGKEAINGFLDDYAFLGNAMIRLYQQTFDEHWLHLSHKISQYAIEHFYDHDQKHFYYTSDLDPELIVRPTEYTDNVIPSSSSSILSNLYTLANYFDDNSLMGVYEEVLKGRLSAIIKNPAFHAGWASSMISEVFPPAEVMITGEGAESIRKDISKHYFPEILLSGGEKGGTLSHLGYKYIEGSTKIYVCRNKTCEQPVETAREAIEILMKIYPLLK